MNPGQSLNKIEIGRKSACKSLLLELKRLFAKCPEIALEKCF
jgi:hypothetical protein